MPWNCRTTCERLNDYARGYLSESEEDAVERHLRGCAACREALDLERKLVGIAETRPSCAAPEGFAASVLDGRRRQRTVDAFRRALVFHRAACSDFAFRTFVDPLLWVEYRLHGALASVLMAIAAPLSEVQARLLTEALEVSRRITIPLRLAWRQIYVPLASKVYYL